jgi:phosphate transport system substrate-binding protein
VKITLPVAALFVFLSVSSRSAFAAVEVKGAGGVSEKPLAQSWVSGDSGTKLKYESKNTADAINQLLGKGCDFALIDAPLTAGQIKKAASRHLLYLPTALSAQAVVYNLPGVPSGALKLTPTVLSDIFLGRIKKWDDPALCQLNPGLLLPAIDIRVVHQSDESSMNNFFPSFLARQNHLWTFRREKDKNLHWPVGQNVNGNEKVLGKLRQWAGVIVVMNYSYTQEKQLPVARVRNQFGQFVAPSDKSIAAATPDMNLFNSDQTGPVAGKPGKKVYPLSEMVWTVVQQDYAKNYHNHNKGQALINFLDWLLSSEGQAVISKASYIPLSPKLLDQARTTLSLVQY